MNNLLEFHSIHLQIDIQDCFAKIYYYFVCIATFNDLFSSFSISIYKKGFDGGQQQWFRIEIYDRKTNILIANLSSTQPTFAVNGLDAERLLRISITAVNSKGASDRVILEAFTIKAAEKRMGAFEIR